MIFLYDLSDVTLLGRHRPYYKIVGSVIEDILHLNLCYRLMDNDQLKMQVADICAKYISDTSYIKHRDIRNIEKVCFSLLKHIHRKQEPIVISNRSIIDNDLLIVEVSQWL